jgi:hypothetical protein
VTVVPSWRWAATVGALAVWSVAGPARAANPDGAANGAALPVLAGAPSSSEIDDPKVARRLKTRTAIAAPAASAASPVTPLPRQATQTNPPPPAASAAPIAALPAASETSLPVDAGKPLGTPALAAAPSSSPSAVAPLSGPIGEDAVTRKMQPGAHDDSSATYVPRLKLSYRRFSFVRIGASDPASTTGVAASEPFDVISLDLYPVSSFVRFGLSTQYGAESGKLMGGGDYFIAESSSLGAQIPGNIFTPFAEAFAGGGYLRRMQFGSSVPTAYWQYGVDVGTEIFMAKYACLSVALGYLHPVNGFTKGLSFTSVYVDTWSLKLGVGF